MFRIPIDDDTSLHQLEEQHAGRLFALVNANRGRLRQWLPWLDQNTTVEDTRAFIKATQQQFAEGSGFACGLWHRGELAGVVGLHYIDHANRMTGIGYWVAEAFEGQGLVTRGCAALLDHVFGELRLNCVEIRCAVENTRSRAVPERLGFKPEGILRSRQWLYDRFVDHAVYSMLASDWNTRTPSNQRPDALSGTRSPFSE